MIDKEIMAAIREAVENAVETAAANAKDAIATATYELQGAIAAAVAEVKNEKMQTRIMTVTQGCTGTDPYRFKARVGVEGEDLTVHLVIPIGGVESGLYRSPKAGESVLVGIQSVGVTNSYYLMGYVPDSANNNFGHIEDDGDTADMKTLLDDNGEVFRYKQTGKTAAKEGAEHYSEIGFYQKPAAWKPDKPADYAALSDGYPKIDRINIHSTGDIRESAVNHHQVKAARLELLADSDDTKADTFKGGDMRIKANQDITIEAGGKLTLKAGRSAITISDTGITITSKRVNTDMTNPYDTSISLTPRDGIMMFGSMVNIMSMYRFGISDKFGAGITGSCGVVNLGGRHIAASTIPPFAQLCMSIFTTLESGLNIGTTWMAHNTAPEASDDVQWVQKIFKVAYDSANFLQPIAGFFYSWNSIYQAASASAPYMMGGQGVADAEAAPIGQVVQGVNRINAGQNGQPAAANPTPGVESNLEIFEAFVQFAEFLLNLQSSVVTGLDSTWTYNKKKRDSETIEKWRNKLNAAALTVEIATLMVVIDVFTAVCAVTSVQGDAKWVLRYDGVFDIKGDMIRHYYAEKTKKTFDLGKKVKTVLQIPVLLVNLAAKTPVIIKDSLDLATFKKAEGKPKEAL
jgi:hypothetical protein